MRSKSMEDVGRKARSALIVGLCLAGFAHSAVAQSCSYHGASYDVITDHAASYDVETILSGSYC